MRLWSPFYIWRRFFGRYELIDPRPRAKSAPYTFFLPSQDEIDDIKPGDLVKLIFQSVPASPKWEAEKMWVTVKEIHSAKLIGTLDNIPSDMPQLKYGDSVVFEPFHVLDIVHPHADAMAEKRKSYREYWDRCLVEDCVIYEDMPVGLLYREEPVPQGPGSEFLDSGWRIRGDQRGRSNENLDSRKTSFVALGTVLNRDDSWLSLIDAPVGSRYLRDFPSGKYRQVMMPSV
jgi:hypothetical protein